MHRRQFVLTKTRYGSVPPGRFKYLRQAITLTGLGSPSFDDAVASAQEIYLLFQRQFPEGKLQNWSSSTFRDYPTLELSNRYFTPKKDALNMEHLPFHKTVDPHGILEAMAREGYKHTEENAVSYYARRIDDKGLQR
jgi:hypothetical protein